MATDQAQFADIVAPATTSARPYPPQECGAEHWAMFLAHGEEIWERWICTRDAGHRNPHEQEINGEIGGRRWM